MHNAMNIFNAIWKLGLEMYELLLHCGLQCIAKLNPIRSKGSLVDPPPPPLSFFAKIFRIFKPTPLKSITFLKI